MPGLHVVNLFGYHLLGPHDIGARLDAEPDEPYMLVLDTRYRGYDDTRYAFGEHTLQTALQQAGGLYDSLFVAMPQRKLYDAVERRVVELTAFGDLLLVERLVVMIQHITEHPVVALPGLDDHLALLSFTSGTACHLAEHLEGTFIGPEVGLVQ